MRRRKDPVRFGAERVDEGEEWLIAYDEQDKEVTRFPAAQVIAVQKLEEGGPFGFA